MTFDVQLALFLIAGGVCTDLVTERVPNEWILFGYGAGICYQISEKGIEGMIVFLEGSMLPILFMFPLFVFRMMGGGDIKMFSALGGVLGADQILRCITWSFGLGAVLSLAFLISCGSLRERLAYFFQYAGECTRQRRIIPYGKSGRQPENLHFTVPIFIGVLLFAGGFY